MKIRNEIKTTPNYPKYGAIKTILLGSSITAVLALSGCNKKEKEEEPPPDTKPQPTNPTKNKKQKEAVPKLSDSDNDGIPDINDKCPSQKGVKAQNGCPPKKVIQMMGLIAAPISPKINQGTGTPKIKDSDKDGVPDAKDKCPHTKGKINRNGCPRPRPMGRRIRPKPPKNKLPGRPKRVTPNSELEKILKKI